MPKLYYNASIFAGLSEEAGAGGSRGERPEQGHAETLCIGVIEFFYEAIHYTIGKAHWGKGYMTKAVQAVLQWVRRKYPDLMVIETFVFEPNIAIYPLILCLYAKTRVGGLVNAT